MTVAGAFSRVADGSVRAARKVGRPMDDAFLLRMADRGLSWVEAVTVEPDMREGVRVGAASKRGGRAMVVG